MEQKKRDIYNNELTFLDLIKIFISKKWWFIITFIFVLIASLVFFIFLKPPNPTIYGISSQIKLKNINIGSDNDDFYSYFPEDSERLWISPNVLKSDMVDDELTLVTSELESEEFLKIAAASLNLNYSVTTTDLRNSIDIIRAEDKKSLIINVSSTDKIIAQNIMITVTDSYLSWKSKEFENNYDEFLKKLDKTLEEYSKTIENLIYEREKNSEDLRLETAKLPEEQNSETMIEKRKEINYLDRQIDTKYMDYEIFKRLNNNFIQNKDFYIDKIQVTSDPQINIVSLGDNLKKNVLFILLISFAFALLVTYIIGLASYLRKTYKLDE